MRILREDVPVLPPGLRAAVEKALGGASIHAIPIRPWSNAKPTDCAAGHRHASRLESRVCDRLAASLAPGEVLVQQPRMPLLALPPGPRGRPLYFTPDFLIVSAGRILRAVDAKGRTTTAWTRGAVAFEATYGVHVEVIER